MTQSISDAQLDIGGLPADLFRHWVHSREEDAGELEIYRPDGFDFPPSFARDGFEMFVDGRFVQDDLGPADGIVQTEGRWSLVGPLQVGVSFPGSDRPGYSFEVIEANPYVLRLRRGPAVEEPDRSPSYGAMDERQMQAYDALPPASTAKRLDFSTARIITLESFPPQFVLEVSGTRPYANMDLSLVPFVYIQQPGYWEIEVVGTLPGPGPAVATPYTASIRLSGITGTRGVEVVGATRRERLDLPPEATEGGAASKGTPSSAASRRGRPS